MGKTIQVAADREFDKTKTVVPAEVARGIYIENPPGAQALKLMHLLISIAGGRMADDVQHELRMADMKAIEGMRNHDRTSLKALFRELAAAEINYDKPDQKRELTDSFVGMRDTDYRDEISGNLIVKWKFSELFRIIAAESNHWAILDRQTVFALSSKYAILLFQHIASLANLDRVNAKTFTIPELRAALGVPAGKLDRFSNLNTWALKPALAEINQLSRLDLIANPRKVGRTVASVEISWAVKGRGAKDDAAREVKGHSAGRKARRNGTAETIAAPATDALPAFPATGGFRYAPHWQKRFDSLWADLGRAHADRPDSVLVADHVRKVAKGRNTRLESSQMARILADALKNWK